LERANAQAAAYEEKIRAARNEIYHEQEVQRRLWREEQVARIAQARSGAEAAVAAARADLAAQAEQAKQSLTAETQALADRITRAVLQERAA
jgi:F-type H+-transporting ATPase subunit b